ncbi:amino acid permease [Desulfosporosinus sp. PR]|uniref:amino acid permease n=1 Tax=Candidatus Desulfosporosinus nitrosoreducens TaxID=3401928 RepID=UPI0027E66E8E|nr:amino acid permease [Desulfosporosinus sp. PR]MDQ7095667.1 amino acid permease [Desulfosporosinus sp. PR]
MMGKEKGLTAGHLAMMALGSVIGGSFFLGTSVAINAAGPSIVLSFVLAGVLVYFILFALSEMTVANPYGGSFSTFAAEELGEGVGFVVGWVYWTGTIFSMSSEATAIPILTREWFPNISIGGLGILIIIAVTMLNLLGAKRLSKLESGLSSVKLFAIAFFILLAVLLILGFFPGSPPIGGGELVREPLMPGGVKGIAGSMLIVLFAYAGFEIIGLAASEAESPRETIPKAITYTVLSLVGLYILYIIVLLPLIPTADLSENISPMVISLNRQGIQWAGSVINVVLISASLSAMLAAVFGLGRMIRSLTDEGYAPKWLKDRKDVPYRGILFSGLAMLLGLGFGHLFPRVYLVLITSGGFALLFTYAVIMASHIRFRKRKGCPPEGKCQMPGYPYTSWITLISMIVVFGSMPFIPGQSAGLVTGIIMVVLYSLIYVGLRFRLGSTRSLPLPGSSIMKRSQSNLSTEFSEELVKKINKREKNS